MLLRSIGSIAIAIITMEFAVIACSPTKFAPSVNPVSICQSNDLSCIVTDDDRGTRITERVFQFRVGSGKVDILIVNDRTASMSPTYSLILQRFADFLSNLDQNEIDYRIGMSVADFDGFINSPLLKFQSGEEYLTFDNVNRIQLFNSMFTNLRSSTLKCENFIKSSYYTYGPGFQTNPDYNLNYSKYCVSGDERGIYSAFNVIKNKSSFLRQDSNLNVIVISNEDVRSGEYDTNPNLRLEEFDKPENFITTMNSLYPGKDWEFNAIITKDNNCASIQRASIVDNQGQPIKDDNNNFVIGANIGKLYSQFSNGQTYSICDNDYSQHFRNIANKISDSSRTLKLNCNPIESPIITEANNQNLNVPFDWQPGSNLILFREGSERKDLIIKIKCDVASTI